MHDVEMVNALQASQHGILGMCVRMRKSALSGRFSSPFVEASSSNAVVSGQTAIDFPPGPNGRFDDYTEFGATRLV
jgi:hypothetical protein